MPVTLSVAPDQTLNEQTQDDPTPQNARADIRIEPGSPSSQRPADLAIAVRVRPEAPVIPAAPVILRHKPVAFEEPAKGAEAKAPLLEMPKAYVAASISNVIEHAAPEAPEPAPASLAVTPPEHVEPSALHPARPASPEPLRSLSIQVGQANQERVDLKVTERGGEVHIAVRTADATLRSGLQQNLPELVHRLQSDGFRTDAWRPAGVVSLAGAIQESGQSSPEFQGGDGQPKQGWTHQDGGSRHPKDAPRPVWLRELEREVSEGGNRTGGLYGYIR